MEKLRLLKGSKNRLPDQVRRFGFDCDGTLTDGDSERIHYIEKFKKNLRDALKDKSLFDRFEDASATVSSNLSKYGWVKDGKLVCPAHTDGIIFSQAIGRILLSYDDLDETQIDKKLYELYRDSYAQTIDSSVFRKGVATALSYFASISDSSSPNFVLTNSSTDAVEAKLRILRASVDPDQLPVLPVHGSAMKFVLDDSITQVPEFVSLPSGAKVYARRKTFIDKLNSLFGDIDPSQTVYVGDSLHLDGIGALVSGRNFFFVPNAQTPDEEIHFVLDHPRGYVLESFELK